MNYKRFIFNVEWRISQVRKVLITKMESYMRNDNVFYNFEEGSKITGETSIEVLDGYLLKHLVSYRSIVRDIKDGREVPDEVIEEKIGDIINYFIIQEIQIKNLNEKRTKK